VTEWFRLFFQPMEEAIGDNRRFQTPADCRYGITFTFLKADSHVGYQKRRSWPIPAVEELVQRSDEKTPPFCLFHEIGEY